MLRGAAWRCVLRAACCVLREIACSSGVGELLYVREEEEGEGEVIHSS